jgi:phosphinothricin acetyltransferase
MPTTDAVTASLRDATREDAAAISRIYNHYVLEDTCTWQEQVETLADRQAWLSAHGGRQPAIVAEHGGAVVGWASLSQYRDRSGYRFTAEDSIYLDPAWRGRGLGSQLLCELITRAARLGYRSIIAGISGEQQPSFALHRRYGFREVGRLRAVGYKFGRWLDVAYLQRELTPAA